MESTKGSPGMYDEEDLLPISALQHLHFCPRQCALIYLEQVWQDNALTLEGTRLHERVDERHRERELRGDVLIVRGLPVHSYRLGLSGRTDVVEFHACATDTRVSGGSPSLPPAVLLRNREGLWMPFPVEYKRGRPKPDRCDEVQLCAQGLCLEEMLGVSVTAGALFYGQERRRHDVSLDGSLRSETEDTARRLHALFRSGVTPRAARQPKCCNCSLLERCVPDATDPHRSAARYVERTIFTADGGGPAEP